ncbi:hypothetical protein Tco_0964385, partial [Tanacetum coccineum]
MRLDVSKFSGDDLDRWILAITEYFSLLNTPADQRLQIVSFNLEGVTTEWFQWMSLNGLITTWNRFVESVKSRFGLSKYEDPQRALSILLQLVVGVETNHVGDAFSLARIIEARFKAIAKKDKEQIVKKKTDVILPLQSELASPKIKRSLNVIEDIGVDEVSSARDGILDLGESNMESMEVRSKFGEFSENKKSVEEIVGGGEALGVGEDDDSGNEATDWVMMGRKQGHIHSLAMESRV